jgi:hypothetical protein
VKVYGDVGEHVFLKISFRIAEKTGGKITGKMLSFKENDFGVVVGKRKVNGKFQYSVKVNGQTVQLYGKDLSFVRDSEVFIPAAAMARADFKGHIRERDLDLTDNAEY